MADHFRDATKKADFISREAMLELIDNAPIIAGNENETLISSPELSDYVYCSPAADVRPVVQRDAVMQALNKYFSIGDSYTYELNRVKEAFYVGTMTLDDFEEWNEDNVSDLCDYLMKELFRPNCGADMRPDKNDQRGEKNSG